MEPDYLRRKIRVALAERGLRLSEVAKRADVPLSTAYKVAAGTLESPRVLARLAAAIVENDERER